MSGLTSPGLTYNVTAYQSQLPNNFGQNTGSVWWKNLLRATGQTFLNGLTQTYNAQNAYNPYSNAGMMPGSISSLAIVGLFALLILKK